MTRFLTRLFRKTAKAGVIAFAAATFTAPVYAADKPALVIQGTETTRIAANGDGAFRYELKLPAKGYEMLKATVPDAAVLLRKLGLTNQESISSGVKGEWFDDRNTLRIDYSARGVARVGRGGAWGIPMVDGVETKLIEFKNGVATLSQSMAIPGVDGTATSDIRLTLPAGATDVRISRDKSRLAYNLPEPTTNGQVAKAQFDIDAKRDVMASLAKVLSNRKFANLWTARGVFKNTGDAVLKNYRVRFRMTEFTPAWSPWAGSSIVVPGQTVVDTYHPIMDLEKVGKLTGQTRASVEIQWQYTRPDGKVVEDSDTKELNLLARNQVQYSSMKLEECADWADAFDMSHVVMGCFVTHEDPVIQQTAGRIIKAMGGSNVAGDDKEALKFLAAAYDFMGANIAYQTPPGGVADHKLVQHVKYGRDVLRNKAGTCIDLAILYGSLCEAVGLKPVLFNVPGHCFPGVYLPKSGKLICVESTLIGKADFIDAVNHATEKNVKPIQDGKTPTVKADILTLHNQGVHPIDLPRLSDDVLEKWGITFEMKQQRAKPEPKVEPKTAAPVGLWRTNYRIGNVFVTQTTGVDANGDIGSRSEAANGFVMIRKGTFVMKGKTMHITLTDGTSHSGVVEMNGNDEFKFHADSGEVLVYKRVK